LRRRRLLFRPATAAALRRRSPAAVAEGGGGGGPEEEAAGRKLQTFATEAAAADADARRRIRSLSPRLFAGALKVLEPLESQACMRSFVRPTSPPHHDLAGAFLSSGTMRRE